jgi:very-short-patch-repair endonuclease
MTSLELEFAQLWDERYPSIDLVTQYPVRRYKIDFCHPQAKVAIECQGGTWVAGMGHSSGKGIQRDCEKFCVLASQGFIVFPLTCEMITEKWIDAIAQVIKKRLK